MKYAGINKNDFVNGKGVCVSVWTQGCPFHCEGCHNSETWDFEGGIEKDKEELILETIEAIAANGIQRNLSILGGEPLCPENVDFVNELINRVRFEYPNITILLWTGYDFATLSKNHLRIGKLYLQNIDILITGLYDCTQRDVTLPLRGSHNQEIWIWNPASDAFENHTNNYPN